jgi:hypothetical protein
MSRRSHLAFLALLAGATGCSDRADQSPTAPSGRGQTSAATGQPAGLERAARERLARRLALALADPGFRSHVRDALDRSPIREHKLHFQRFLHGPGHALTALAKAGGDAESAVDADARAAVALELYLPVAAHREAWRGGEDILVATAREDREAPVAFDVRGRRRLLSPDMPPDSPVVAVVPVETDFDASSNVGFLLPDDGGGTSGGGGAGTGSSTPPPGLYMTRSHVVQDFEGWLKGSPEFEVHVLGQAGATDSLTSYQCAGEHASGYYRFDQNSLDWTGSVLLFTQTQLASYKAAHPNSNMRVFVVEDDDTACQIKTDVSRFGSLIKAVEGAYPQLTGGKDTATSVQKFWKRANALQKILRAIASLITTNDDLVGNAVESTVAGEYYPGANWVVKGEGNVTNGWLNLVMR